MSLVLAPGEAELPSRGHDTLAPDLPWDDDSAGLKEYRDTVVQAIGDRTDLVVVAQSFGGFTAPLVDAMARLSWIGERRMRPIRHRPAVDESPKGGLTMATYVLIHGAGDVGWYWHLVETELRARGHGVAAPDLPCEDDSAGLPEYADAVIEAIGDRTGLVVVAQSLGGFTAPLVCDRIAVDLLVLVAPMIPAPGEAPADYWANTRYEDEVRETYDEEIALFYHDVPPQPAAEALKRGRPQSEARMHEPWPMKGWPDVPTRVLLCRDDRLFPASFLRRVARERLGITPDEIDGGHTPALSRPKELADRLERYRLEIAAGTDSRLEDRA